MNLDFNRLAKCYATPLYIYDFNHFTKQYERLKQAFFGKKSLLTFAVKANSNLTILKHFASLDAGADCVSIMEIKKALLAGIDKYKIIFSGVGKTANELKQALELGILFINIESEAEFLLLEQIAANLKQIARISIRVNPNVNPKTHPYIATGLQESKFGVSLEIAKKLYLKAKNSKHLDPVGVHFHIGSQLTDLKPIEQSCNIIADLARSLKAVDINLKFFDVGGGLAVQYKDETLINEDTYAKTILSQIKALDMTVICESGRYFTAGGGYLLSSVLYEKYNGSKRFVVVDAAMNDMMRPCLYGAFHKVRHFKKNMKILNHNADIVGPVCESADFLAKNVALPELKSGDLIVLENVGAYGMSLASNYNSRPRAAEVAILDNHDFLIRKRETFEDLIANEKEFI